MKKWFVLALTLSGCLFQQEKGTGSEWLDSLSFDLKDRVELIQISDLKMTSISTLNKWETKNVVDADTVFYDSRLGYGITRTLSRRLPIGVQKFADLGDSIEYQVHTYFEISDSIAGFSTKRDSLYQDVNQVNSTLSVYPDTTFYLNDSIPQKIEFEIEWFLNTWVDLGKELSDVKRREIDSLMVSRENWQKIIEGTVEAQATGSFSFVSELNSVKDSNGVEKDQSYPIEFPSSFDELLVKNKDKEMTLSVVIKAKKLSTPFHTGISISQNSLGETVTNFPTMSLAGKLRNSVLAAFKAKGGVDDNSIYAGAGDTLSLVPDFAQIKDALKKAGYDSPSNLNELIVSASLKLELPSGYTYESPRGMGAWLNVISTLDSNANRNADKIIEYQKPALDSILKTGAASYWISNDKKVSELTWLVGYGMRSWFNYGTADTDQKFKMVLLQANQTGDTLSDTNYDIYDRPAKLNLKDLSALKWSLDLVVLKPGEEL